MDIQQSKLLREMVQGRILELEHRLEATDTAINSADHSDDASASLDETITSTVGSQLAHHEKEEIIQLKHVLTWLDSEDAGYCQNCGSEIPFDRLQAVPSTQLCIQCAS